jgi:O-antigen/teichoic acid export membrane protein
MIAVAAVQTASHLWVFRRALGQGHAPGRFSWPRLRAVGRFSAGVTGIGILGFFLLQADRLVLSRLLPLDRFGVYAIAATVAVMFSKASQPWFAAVYPRLSELHSRHDPQALGEAYHASSQWVAVTVLPAAAVLALYAGPLLELWSRQPDLAAQAAPVFSILIIGYALNGLMTMPYALQLAVGWTRLTLAANLVASLAIVPAIVWLNARFGLAGAAAAWPLLNATFLAITIPLMHRRILRGGMKRWYLSDTVPALAVNLLLALAASWLAPPEGSAAGLARIALTYAVLLACTLMVAPRCRSDLATLLRTRRAIPIP